jgi:hypothetical protein
MNIEQMYAALMAGEVTLEQFESWVYERETEYQSFCSYESSTFVE